MTRSLPAGTYHDEDLGAVGGAVGGEAAYPLPDALRATSHEVLYSVKLFTESVTVSEFRK